MSITWIFKTFVSVSGISAHREDCVLYFKYPSKENGSFTCLPPLPLDRPNPPPLPLEYVIFWRAGRGVDFLPGNFNI